MIDSKSEKHRSIVQTDFSNDVIDTLEFQNNLNEYSKVLYLDSFVNLKAIRLLLSPFLCDDQPILERNQMKYLNL